MTLDMQTVVIGMIDKSPAAYEELLLGTVAEDYELFKKVKDSLCIDTKGNSVQDFQNPLYNGLYEVLKMFYLHVYKNPGDSLQRSVLDNLLPTVARLNPDLALQSNDNIACWELLEHLKTKGYAGAASLAEAGFEHWCGKRRVHGAVSEIMQLPNWKTTDLSSRVADVLGNVTLEKPETQFAFSSGLDDENEEEVFRLKLNIGDLDAKLGGGIALGEAMMALTAPAGGKTVFATQVAANLSDNISLAAEANGAYPAGSNMPAKGLLVTTEQEHKELVPRIISQRSDYEIPFDTIKEGLRNAGLSDSQKSLVRDIEAKLRDRLRIENWVAKPDTKNFKEDLRILIEGFIAEQGYMDFLVFDWVGGALSERLDGKLDMIRQLYLRAAESLCEVAKEYNIAVIYLVQGKKEDCVRKGSRVDQSCCQECKTMDNKATWSIGISIIMTNIADAENPETAPTFEEQQFFFICKGRKSKGGLVKVCRHFEYQKFGDSPLPGPARAKAEAAAQIAAKRSKG